MAKRLLTVSEAAERLGVSARTLRRWDREGKLRAWRDPTNDYRLYDPDDLSALSSQPASSVAPSERPIGREKLIAAVREALKRGPVVLTGLPGIGKTRVARAVDANALLVNYDPSTSEPAQLDALRARITEAEPLIVLDGWPSDAEFEPWRRAIVDARWLVTSWWAPSDREATVLAVPPLESADAVELLVRRASQWGVDLPRDAAAERLAVLLDGHPLAIELAAMQTPLLGPEALADLIATEPAALASDRRDAPDRHRSLAAAFGPALAALDRDQRAVLAALSVFAGGADTETCAAVAEPIPVARVGAALDTLRARGWASADERMRAHAHPILRLAVSGLGLTEALEHTHARTFANLAEHGSPEQLRLERSNLEAAVARQPTSEEAARILVHASAFDEGTSTVHADRLRRAMHGARSRDDRPSVARLAARLFEPDLAASQGIEDATIEWEIALARAWSGPLETLSDLARRAPDRRLEAIARARLGERRIDRRQIVEAIAELKIARERCNERADREAEARVRTALARAYVADGALAEAELEIAWVQDELRSTERTIATAEAALAVGVLRLEQGRLGEAEQAIAEAIERAASLGLGVLHARATLEAARLEALCAATESAWRLAEEARARAERTGDATTAARALAVRGLAAVEYAPSTAVDDLRASGDALKALGCDEEAETAAAWAWIAAERPPADEDDRGAIGALLRPGVLTPNGSERTDLRALHDALAAADAAGSVARLTASLIRHGLRTRGLPVRTLEIGPDAEWVLFGRERLELRTKARLRAVLLAIVDSGDRGAQVEDVLAEVWAGEDLEGHVSGHRVHHAVGLLRRLGLACLEHHEGRYRVNPDTRVLRA